MLGKLIKHEFKDTYKLICVYYAVLGLLTILGIITVKGTNSMQSTNILLRILMFISVAAYSVMMGILGLVTIMVLCSQFDKTMYGDRGYLTHTLPVKKGEILASKYIVSVVWCIVSLFVMFLSLMIYVSFLSGDNLFHMLFTEITDMQWQSIDEFVREQFGCGLVSVLLLVIVTLIVAVMHLFSFLWAAISIGQLANERRKPLAIFAGIILWFAEFLIKRAIQDILHLSFYGGLLEVMVETVVVETAMPGPRVDQAILLYLIMTLVFLSIETFITWFISSKKLNLA